MEETLVKLKEKRAQICQDWQSTTVTRHRVEKYEKMKAMDLFIEALEAQGVETR